MPQSGKGTSATLQSALQSEGRRSAEGDWQTISGFEDFAEGFKAFADKAALAGWGRGQLLSLDREQRQLRFRVEDCWEGRYQKLLGVCLGSAMVAGKLAGFGTKLFGTDCCVEQIAFIARGDPYDEFIVTVSSQTRQEAGLPPPTLGGVADSQATAPLDRGALACPADKREDTRSAAETPEAEDRQWSSSPKENLLATVLQSTVDGIVVVGPNGEILIANERFYEICAISEELRRNQTDWRFVEHGLTLLAHPKEFQAELERLLATNEEKWILLELKDGRFLDVCSSPLLVEGKPGRIWSVRDVTARKRMEIELSESQAFNRCLFSDSSIPLVVLDPATGRFTDCNAAAVAIYGYQSREEVLGKKPEDVSTETQYDGTDSGIGAREHIRLSLRKKVHSFEWRHQRPGGEVWDGEVRLMRFEYQAREFLQFSLVDITQRRRAQRRDLLLNKLNESLLLPGSLSARMQLIADAVAAILEPEFVGVWLLRARDSLRDPTREGALHLSACSGRNALFDREAWARVPLDHTIGRAATAQASGFVTNDLAADPRVHNQEWAGSLGTNSFAAFRLQATAGSPAGVLALFSQHPISAEDEVLIESLANTTSLVVQAAQAVETLRTSEDKFARAFRVSPDALIISRVEDGVVIEVNDGFCAMTGHQREEILGRTTLEFGLWCNPEDRSRFVSELRAFGRQAETEYQFRTKSGQVLDCTISAEAIVIGEDRCSLSILRDITKRKQAERDLLREKQFTEKLLEGLPGIFFLYDETCHLKRWNKAHETATGFSAEELRDWYIPDWHETPEEAAIGMALVKSVLETGVGGAFETTLINKEGRFVPYLITITRLLTPDGPVMMGVGIDITERTQTERELLREKQFTEKLLESLPGIFFLYDSTCHLKRWNKAHETATGFSAEELRDWYIPDWHETPEDAALGMALVKSVLETGVGGAFETTLINKEGRFVPYLISITRLLTPDGPFMMGVGMDITERKQMEQALSVSEKRFRSIALNLPGVVFQFFVRKNGERGFRFVSDRALEVFGLDQTPDDLFAYVVRGIPSEDRQRFLTSVEKAIQEVSPWEYEGRFTQHSGKQMYVRILSHPERQEEEVMFYGVLLDITDRHRAEEERERLTAILDNTSDVVMMYHPRGDLFYLNAAGRRLLHWGETAPLDSHAVSELYPAWAYEVLQDKARTAVDLRGSWQGETSLRGADGREIPVSQLLMAHRAPEGHLEYYSSILRDITERKRVEQERLEIERQLLHTQKLESLGVLAGGIAHDFNNLLMAISGNLDLALLDLSPAVSARDYILRAMQASQRASDLTRQMLAYSGKGRFILERIDLSELVLENAHLLRASMAKTVSLQLDIAPGLSSIEADPGQLQQVIMNLITNASEALGEQVGVITITTGEQHFDETYLRRSRIEHKPRPGQYVFLEVKDTGCGMDEATLARLFDPFFTTKFTGRGLGLAAVLGIVGGHRGAIFVDSRPGRGSTIRVLFPVALPVTARKDSSPLPARGSVQGFSGMALIVDDEETVRQVCRSYLGRLGLTTLCASDGAEALALFERHVGEVVCVVLDLNMPRMDGLSAFRRMKTLRPDVQVILCSGYNEQEATQQFLGEGLAAFLQKPYRLQDLKQKIEQVLGACRRS